MRRFLSPGLALLALSFVVVIALWSDSDRQAIQPDQPPVTQASDASASQLPGDLKQWLSALKGAEISDADLEEGRRIAKERRTAFLALMRRDPEAALRQAVTFSEHQSLPPSIRALVEEPFSELARVSVLPVCRTEDGQEPMANQIVEIDFGNGRSRHEGFIYGRRNGVMSKNKTPVQGVRLDGLAALWESTFLALDATNAQAVAARYPLANVDGTLGFASGEPVGDHAVTAIAGGQRFVFKDDAEFRAFDAAVSKLDESPGPHSGAGLLFAMPKGTDGGDGFDLEGLVAASNAQASSWTETPKSVFLIRIDFPDRTSATDPLPAAGAIEQVFDTTVDEQIQLMSHGKTSIECTVTTDITRVPSNTATYVGAGSSSNNDLLLTDATNAYQAANPGWNPGDYDIVGVYFVSIGMKGSGITYGGLAGGSDLWLQGTYGASLVTHELGHNYGLGHSSFWVPPGVSTNPVDPGGANEEYGDIYDIMGDGDIPEGHFNAQGKAHLNWITTSEWTDVNAAGSGLFRIYRIDDPTATGLRGLRATKGADEFYWIAHRRAYVNESLDYGGYLQWERPGFSRAWLLDLTPESQAGANDKQDAGLLIGSTYTDTTAGVHITPVARGGVAPNEWIDVQVNLGSYPGNQAPMVTIDGPSTIPARTTAMLTANATDGDGDPLAYSWDLGDGKTADNNPSIPHAWTLGGSYTVTVTVSDMKGGTATATKMVTVTDDLDTWTARTVTGDGDLNALAHDGTRVVVVGDRDNGGSFTGTFAHSTDGATWTSGSFATNGNMYAVCHDGSNFIAAGARYSFDAPAGWRAYIATSPDGATWTQRYWAGTTLNHIVTGGGTSLAWNNNGLMLRSVDGMNWGPVTFPVTASMRRIGGIAYGNGVFTMTSYEYDDVAAQYSGSSQVHTSLDGLTWTDVSSATSIDAWKDLRGIAFLNQQFFASGWFSQFRSAQNPANGFVPMRPEFEEMEVMAYGGGVYFAKGVRRTLSDLNGTNVALASQNGLDWVPLPNAAGINVDSVVFFNNTFIGCGGGMTLLQSGSLGTGASGFVGWRNTYFPDRGTDSRIDGETDFDSLKTLVEYGVGASPLSGAGVDGVDLIPTPTTSDTDALLAGRLALCFSLPDPAPSDIRYTVEVSGDDFGTWTPLARKTGTGAWQWLGGGTARVMTSTSGGRETVKVGDTELVSAGGRRFIHLVVEIAPAAP